MRAREDHKQYLMGTSIGLKDPDNRVRNEAAWALGHTGPDAKTVIGPLSTALLDDDSGVRAWAAVALGRLGPEAKGAVVPLTDALSDRHESVRAAAAESLGQLGSAARGAVPGLIVAWRGRESYHRRNELVQTAVVGAISPRPRVPSPWDFQEEPDSDDRKAAARALKRIDPTAVRALGGR